MITGVDTLRPTVLLIDDDLLVLNALQRSLKKTGWNILTAGNRRDALHYCEEHRIDVVICDIRMPDCNGTELLAAINQRWPDTIRITLSGSFNHKDIINAINKGRIHHYLTKPWQDQELLEILNSALRSRLVAIKTQQRLFRLEAEFAERDAESTAGADILNMRSSGEEERPPVNALKDAHTLGDPLLFDKSVDADVHPEDEFSRFILQYPAVRLPKYQLYWRMINSIVDNQGGGGHQIQSLRLATLFHELGKLALPAHISARAESTLSGAEAQLYFRYPQLGADLFLGDPALTPVGRIILSHRQTLSSSHLPTNNRNQHVPLESLILGCMRAWFDFAQGLSVPEGRLENACLGLIRQHSDDFSPSVVEMVIAALKSVIPTDAELDRLLSVEDPVHPFPGTSAYLQEVAQVLREFPAGHLLVDNVRQFLRKHHRSLLIDLHI